MGHSDLDPAVHDRRPWIAGVNVGPKRPLKPRDIWAIRFPFGKALCQERLHLIRDQAHAPTSLAVRSGKDVRWKVISLSPMPAPFGGSKRSRREPGVENMLETCADAFSRKRPGHTRRPPGRMPWRQFSQARFSRLGGAQGTTRTDYNRAM